MPDSKMSIPPRLRDTAIGLMLPLGVLIATYWRLIPDGWFSADDTLTIRRPLELGLPALFLEPEAWRQVSPNFLMPWVAVSHWIDFSVFGLQTSGYYLHQLFSAALAVVLVFVVIRRFSDTPTASIGVTLWVASRPFGVVTSALMTRHYIEGLVFALVALLLFVKETEEQSARPWRLWLAALFYWIAMANKEVYATLPLVLLALPVGTWRQRFRGQVAFVVAALGYATWRVAMLGVANVGTAYGDGAQRSLIELGSELLAWVGLMSEPLGLRLGWHGVLLLVLFGVLLAVQAKSGELTRMRLRPGVMRALLILSAILIPLLPVVPQTAARLFWLPSLVVAVAFALLIRGVCIALEAEGGVPATTSLAAAALLFLLWLVPSWSQVRTQLDNRLEYHARLRTEGEFLLETVEPGLGLFTTVEARGHFSHLLWLRRHRDSRAGGSSVREAGTLPTVCANLCVCGDQAENWRTYDAERRALRVADLASGSEACLSDPTLEMMTHYDVERSRLRWCLGPYPAGEYQISLNVWDLPSTGHFIPLPRVGSAPMYLAHPLELMIRHRHPGQSFRYSEFTTLDPEAGRLRRVRSAAGGVEPSLPDIASAEELCLQSVSNESER